MARSTSLRNAARRALLASIAAGSLTGCGRVRQAVAGVFSRPENVVDAHSVTLQRAGCPTLAARTIRHGYTVLTPADTAGVRASGLFEGPALVGTYVFRYVPPGVGATWDGAREAAETVETRVAVAAVDVELPDVRSWLDRFCGPDDGAPGEGTPGEGTPGEGTPGEGTPGEAIPRVPRPS